MIQNAKAIFDREWFYLQSIPDVMSYKFLANNIGQQMKMQVGQASN